MILRKTMLITSTLGKTSKPQFVKLPEIPAEWKRETRPQEEKVEEMLLNMGFTPFSEGLRNQVNSCRSLWYAARVMPTSLRFQQELADPQASNFEGLHFI